MSTPLRTALFGLDAEQTAMLRELMTACIRTSQGAASSM